jgi:hypothetical protein
MQTQMVRGRFALLLLLAGASIRCGGAAFTAADDSSSSGGSGGGNGSAGTATRPVAGTGSDEPDEPGQGGTSSVEPGAMAGQAGIEPDDPGVIGSGGGGEDPTVTELDLAKCGADAFGTGIMPTLYSTLDSAVAVTEPAIGELGFVGNAEGDYHGGPCGLAINIDQTGDYIKYHYQDNDVRHFDPRVGGMDFWYMPSFSHTDGLNHDLFGTANWATVGGMRLRKASAENLNAFQVILRGAVLEQVVQINVPASEYELNAGEWTRITLIWYLAADLPERYARLFLNAQLVGEVVPPNTFQMAPDPDGFFVLGVWDFGDAQHASGLLDDFKVFSRGP